MISIFKRMLILVGCTFSFFVYGQENNNDDVDIVNVTAQRAEEGIQDVPIAVTCIVWRHVG